MSNRRINGLPGILVALAVLTPILTRAGTPPSGTLSPSTPSLSYSGGPFANDNDSAPVGGVTPTCAGDVLPCDQYALKVSSPPSDGTSYLVTVSISWPRTAADFDMTILDANGNEVAQSATSSDPEVASFTAISRV